MPQIGVGQPALNIGDDSRIQRWLTAMCLVHGKVRDVQDLFSKHDFASFFLLVE
jgi:hypothetical protein